MNQQLGPEMKVSKVSQPLKLRLLAAIALAFSANTFADPVTKVEFAAGGYSLSAKTKNGSKSVSGIGSYRAAYRRSIMHNLELLIGYSLFTSEITGGDLGYGPDVGVLYYPLSSAQPVEIETQNVHLYVSDVWHPYIGTAFHQRQFQSTSSSYAGFSLSVGAEFSYAKDVGTKFEIRYQLLDGPANASASYYDALIGIVLYY